MENIKFSPTKFDQYIGQQKIINNLEVYLSAAKKRDQVIDHIIIHGNSGCGKTTLANIIAGEMGTIIKVTNGVNIQKVSDVISLFANIEYGSVLFIDEIHRLPKNIEEIIYSILDDFRLDLIYGSGIDKQTINLDINKFTLIGATTMYGKLSEPLRNRFSINLELQEYKDEEIKMIINRTCEILQLNLDNEAINICVVVSRKTPRTINNILKRINDFTTEFSMERVSESNLISILEKMGIQKNGLTDKEVEALNIIYKSQPIGSEAISKKMGIDKITYEITIDSYLVKMSYIDLTKAGRTITKEGLNIIKE